MLEDAIDNVQNMNPARKARKEIYLKEGKPEEKEELRKSLQSWIEILSSSEDVTEMVEACQQKTESADGVLRKNLKAAVTRTRDLERSYRSVALFFKNTESVKVKNVSFLNADLEQLKALDNDRFIKAVEAELKQVYDVLDLRSNYGLLIIPGYLGSNTVLSRWSKIAYENKALLVTDFRDLDSADDVMEMFEDANLTGGDPFRSNTIMTCNWLLGRSRAAEIDEADNLYVPPAAALGGKIYNTKMSQVAAGKKFGGINEVDGVRFELQKSDIANLEKLGLIPMVKAYGMVMAFSAKTLFNGDNIGLQTYSVVRVFDWVTKVLMDFLNRRTYENFTADQKKDLNGQIVRFLDGITGPKKLIEDFRVENLQQDKIDKTRIYLDVFMKPYFPAKTFMIKLDGHKGQDHAEWLSEYAEQK